MRIKGGEEKVEPHGVKTGPCHEGEEINFERVSAEVEYCLREDTERTGDAKDGEGLRGKPKDCQQSSKNIFKRHTG